eukprot:g14836.t1
MADGQHQRSPQQFAPLWVRARGGAVGKRAGGVQPHEDAAVDDDDDEQEEDDGVGSAAKEQGEVGDDDSEVETEAAEDASKEGQGQGGGQGGVDTAGATATAPAPAAAAAGGSVLATLDVKRLVPQAMKTGLFFLLAQWLGNKLQPTIESHVRTARAIYTAYLVFSQALCMYIRYLIWKKNDDTEMEVPPPPQLKNFMEAGKAGVAAEATGAAAGGGEGGAKEAAGGLGGAASSLGPMLDKMMTSKRPVKKYDMNTIQGMRRGQFWASLLMCYTHLRRGMIKPMMLQASFGVLRMLDSPLFHIYVLGREAKGNLARPFKPQGLMASLSGPMEAMSAKAAEAQAAMAAAEGKAEAEKSEAKASEEDMQAKQDEEDDKASGSGQHQGDDHDDDDGNVEMPGIQA